MSVITFHAVVCAFFMHIYSCMLYTGIKERSFIEFFNIIFVLINHFCIIIVVSLSLITSCTIIIAESVFTCI